jgi:hypothetical protein
VDFQHPEVSKVRLCIDSQGAKDVICKMSSKSPMLMRELRVLNRLLQKLDIILKPEWLLSTANFLLIERRGRGAQAICSSGRKFGARRWRHTRT